MLGIARVLGLLQKPQNHLHFLAVQLISVLIDVVISVEIVNVADQEIQVSRFGEALKLLELLHVSPMEFSQ